MPDSVRIRLAEVQRAILTNAASCLRVGGALVYGTCTLTQEENENVVRTFLERHPGFALAPTAELPDEVRPAVGDDGFLRLLPHVHDADGFFAARFERRS